MYYRKVQEVRNERQVSSYSMYTWPALPLRFCLWFHLLLSKASMTCSLSL